MPKKEVLDEFRGALPGSRIGKGCIRFAQPDRIDFEMLEQLLLRTAESKSAPCQGGKLSKYCPRA